ncbi:DEAD/DEAH box helicase family protein [Litchfieldella rifensis]|uniref:DEAD/DEAH box helicase family protein n=1 Tax=Litchfieldella rifensis TaxID=762643 RepID=A0ABV7LWK8_9GAMM
MEGLFLDSRRLLDGPWNAFERDIARLLVQNGFEDVRIVGGPGDKGADVLGVKKGRLWVVQCKFTSGGYPDPRAVDEVIESGRFYGAERYAVATSRPWGPAMHAAVDRWAKLGIKVDRLDPPSLVTMMRRSPEYPRSRRDLRRYQECCVDKLVGALRETGRGQLVLATGLGKTVVMAEATAQLLRDGVIDTGRVLVLADKRELVDQLQRAFWQQLPKTVPTHRLADGEEPSFWDGITFATVQSVASRLDSIPEFGLVWVDEAHHIGSESFRKVIDVLSPPMLGGATATPWRGDNYDIDQLLGEPVIRMGIDEGLRRGFLCEADYRLLADNIDWEFVRNQSRHSYSIKELNTRLLIPTRDEEAARMIADIFQREQRQSVVVFCASVAHAKAFAGMLRLYGFEADAITGDLEARERDKRMAALRKGSLNAVTTVDIFNEGVDVPDVDMLAFMRVTHSRRIFVQQLGRGLRISPHKEKVVVLDFVSDLRRISEVVRLQAAVAGDVERLHFMERVVQFHNAGAGEFMLDWMLDQADLMTREGDSKLDVPQFNFPEPAKPGSVQ